MKSPPTDTEQKSVLLRMPPSLHRTLKQRADAEHRTVSAHLRFLVEQDVKPKLVEGPTREDAA
jgi:hypothetical protein